MIKSPLNYIGGKYRILSQILPLFPEEIDTFVDLFSGGLDVSLNVCAQHIVCNDINHYVVGMFRYFQSLTVDGLLEKVHEVIDDYSLSKENGDGYYALREEYNRTHQPLGNS